MVSYQGSLLLSTQTDVVSYVTPLSVLLSTFYRQSPPHIGFPRVLLPPDPRKTLSVPSEKSPPPETFVVNSQRNTVWDDPETPGLPDGPSRGVHHHVIPTHPTTTPAHYRPPLTCSDLSVRLCLVLPGHTAEPLKSESNRKYLHLNLRPVDVNQPEDRPQVSGG